MRDFNREIWKLFEQKMTGYAYESFGEYAEYDKVEKFVNSFMRAMSINCYSREKNTDAKYVIHRFIKRIKEKSDSKAEIKFADIFLENDIEFEFQKNIGQYRVDFLFENKIIFECDGPQHRTTREYDQKRDRYITSKGYTVLRCDLDILVCMIPEVIEKLKKIVV